MKRSVIYLVLLLVLFFTFKAFSVEATFERKGEYGIGAIDDVVVDGNYAYCASSYYGLLVFDVSNSHSPSLVATYHLSTQYTIFGFDWASIKKQGDYVFLGFEMYDGWGGGIYIFDVSNPRSPVLKSYYSADIMDFDVSGDYLYFVCFPDDFSILDISNVSSPTLINNFSISMVDAFRGLKVYGDYLYAIGTDNFGIIDVSDKNNPSWVTTFNMTDGVHDLVVSGNYVIVAAGKNGLYAVDISDKSNPSIVSHYTLEGDGFYYIQLATFGVVATGMHFGEHGSYADYMTLSYVTFYPITSPQLAIYKDNITHYSNRLCLNGNNIYISAGTMGLMVYELTEDNEFAFDGGYYSCVNPYTLTVYGDYLYTTSFRTVSWIFDNSSFPDPHPVKTLGYDPDNVFYGGIIKDNKGFCLHRITLADGTHKRYVAVYDLSNPANPADTGLQLPDDYREHNYIDEYTIDGNYLYVSYKNECVQIYDISDLNNVRKLGTYPINEDIRELKAHGNVLAVFYRDYTTFVDVSDKNSPVAKSSMSQLAKFEYSEFKDSYLIGFEGDDLLVVDVSDIANPQIVSSYTFQEHNYWGNILIVNDLVFVTRMDIIYVFDISDLPDLKLDCKYEDNSGAYFSSIAQWGEYLVFGDMHEAKLYTYKYLASSYKIITEAGEGGKVEPSGVIDVPRGDSLTVNIIPDDGYFIKDVVVDGVSVGRVESYTFEEVSMSHSLKASFATSLPPEIRSTDASPVRGNVPLKVNFTCDAYDPDGGEIVEYLWIIYGDLTDRVTTTDGNMSYVFTKPGTYHVSVYVTDDEGEVSSSVVFTVTGERANIEAQQSSMIVPIPMPSSLSGKGLTISDCITRITNKFDNVEVNVQLKMLDNSNNVVSTRDFVIPGNGQLTINPKDYSDTNFSNMIAVADNSVISSTTVKTENGTMSAYIDSVHCSSLYIPHIAEERDYWDSMMFLGNTSPNRVSVSISGNSSEFEMNTYASFVDLEQYMGENPEESKTWGFIKSMAPNPFDPSPSSLTGFEFFVHNGTDGAGCELQGEGSKTLYIPHIPEETDIFWTGFAIVNVEDRDANVIFEFYKSDGTFVGSQNITIPANSKLKGLMSGLFPDYAGQCEWGIIKSDRKLVGIEIYGTAANAICGYNLPSSASCRLVLPEMVVGENLWSGIAITAPGESGTFAYVILYSKDGTKKAEKMETIESKNRFKAVVSDYFSDQEVSIEEGDYIAIVSVNPVVAIIVNGDLDRKFMSSLVGR